MSPRIIDNPKEYVYNLVASDSLFKCEEVRNSSFILTGGYKCDSPITEFSKNYRTIHGWGCYYLVYDKKYEYAVEKLIEMLEDWKIYYDDNPEWFTDICDFLDI